MTCRGASRYALWFPGARRRLPRVDSGPVATWHGGCVGIGDIHRRTAMSVNGLSHGKLATAQIAPLLDRKPAKSGDPTAVAQQRIAAKLDTDGDGALSVA